MEETDERGRQHRTTRNKDEGRGTPQGASALAVAGESVHATVRAGLEDAGARAAAASARIVNYADDFVICCRGTADEAMAAMRDMMAQAEADGERGEDAAVPRAGGDVRLPGLHVRPVLLAADGPGLSGHAAVGEEGSHASATRSAS